MVQGRITATYASTKRHPAARRRFHSTFHEQRTKRARNGGNSHNTLRVSEATPSNAPQSAKYTRDPRLKARTAARQVRIKRNVNRTSVSRRLLKPSIEG